MARCATSSSLVELAARSASVVAHQGANTVAVAREPSIFGSAFVARHDAAGLGRRQADMSKATVGIARPGENITNGQCARYVCRSSLSDSCLTSGLRQASFFARRGLDTHSSSPSPVALCASSSSSSSSAATIIPDVRVSTSGGAIARSGLVSANHGGRRAINCGSDHSEPFARRGSTRGNLRGGSRKLWAAAGLVVGAFSGTAWAMAASAAGTTKGSGSGSGSVVVEPATGTKFSAETAFPGLTNPLTVLGTGVRVKKIAIVSVKVYAVAFYAESRIIESLQVFKGKTAEQLGKDPHFFEAVVDAPVDKCIEIVLARDIDVDTFWGALNDALTPRLKALKAGPEADKALMLLGDAIKGRALKKNTGICLGWRHPGSLEVAAIDDASIPLQDAKSISATIESKTLLAALYDVYLGPNSVAPTLRTSVALGTASSLEV